MIRACWALTLIHLKLAYREKNVLFFTYVFPLIFLFGFGQFIGSQSGGMMTRIVSMVLVIGILGNGLFGAGLRSVVEREQNILRRYKVTPITPVPLLVASMVTGWLLYLPSAALVIVLSHFVYKTPWPDRWVSLFVLLTLGSIAFRAIGMIIGAIANSTAEATALVQLLYLPMLLLSGATFPITMMPVYVQIAAQFLPATYLNTGMQQVLLHTTGLSSGWRPAAALLLTTAIGLLLSSKLFRWEKEERISGRAKLWAVAVFLPFLVLGAVEAYSREQISQTRVLDRAVRRRQTRLIRDVRIFIGDGSIIEQGSVLLKDGRIEQVWDRSPTKAEESGADIIEAAGKTLLPGLIDVHVHLGAPGGTLDQPVGANYDPQSAMQRAAAAYLFSGVTAVKSTGDFTTQLLELRRKLDLAVQLGTELFLCGPLFTAPGGHGTEYFRDAPAFLRELSEREFTRLPRAPAEARAQVHALKERGVDGIKAVLEAGTAGRLFQRMDLALLRAVAEQAAADKLPLVVHTGDSRDVADALEAGAAGIEHGSARDRIPDPLFLRMKERGVFYDPTLSVLEALTDLRAGRVDLLERTLVQQAAPPGLLSATRQATERSRDKTADHESPVELEIAMDNLKRAWQAGVPLVTGTDSGNPLLIHGPAIHRELQLWVKAGIPVRNTLQAATYNAARLLGASSRIGLVKAGYEASLLLVDGNPLQDVTSTERISAVYFKGERVDRQGLFHQK